MGPLTQIGASLDASAHKQDYLLGSCEEAALRQSGTTAINHQFHATLAQLCQYLASNKMPAGTMVGAMHGMAQKQGKATATLETDIGREKGSRKLNYLNGLKTARTGIAGP